MLDSVKWLRVELGDCEQSSDPRGILLKIGGGGGVPPRYPNPDPISDQKMFFSHSHVIRPGLYNPYPFSHLPLRNYVFISKTRKNNNREFLKPISNSHVSSSFLFIWNRNDK